MLPQERDTPLNDKRDLGTVKTPEGKNPHLWNQATKHPADVVRKLGLLAGPRLTGQVQAGNQSERQKSGMELKSVLRLDRNRTP